MLWPCGISVGVLIVSHSLGELTDLLAFRRMEQREREMVITAGISSHVFVWSLDASHGAA